MSLIPESEQTLPAAIDEPRHATHDGLAHTLVWLPTQRHAPLVAALQATADEASYQAAWLAVLAQPDVRIMRHLHGHYRRPRLHTTPGYGDAAPRLVTATHELALRLEQLQHRALATELAARVGHYHAWWCTATQVWASAAPVSAVVQTMTHAATVTVQLVLRVQWQHPQSPIFFQIPNALRNDVVAL